MYYAMQDRMLLSPPVNLLVAGYLGYKPPEPRRRGSEEFSDLQELIDMFGGGAISG